LFFPKTTQTKEVKSDEKIGRFCVINIKSSIFW